MARFEFRLATLLRLREIHRDELRGRLAEAYQAEQLLAEQAQQVQIEIDALQASRRQQSQATALDVNRLLETQRYQSVLQAQQTTIQEQGRLLAEETEKRREALVEADRQVKVLVKLKQRQLKKHRQQLASNEVKILDEVASRRTEVKET